MRVTMSRFILYAISALAPLFAQTERGGPCTVTVSDDESNALGTEISIVYQDPETGGLGGAITFEIATDGADSFQITDDGGFDTIVTATPGSTTVQLNTLDDGTPRLDQTQTVYTITPRFGVPPDPVVEGEPCTVTARWLSTGCVINFAPLPRGGEATQLNLTVLNGRFIDGDYGRLFRPNGESIPLTDPVRSGNSLSFTAIWSTAALGDADEGIYSVLANSPRGPLGSCSRNIVFGDVELIVGDLTIDREDLSGSNVLVQVPILIRDNEHLTRANNGIRSITFTLELSGDTEIIVGDTSGDMLVSNAFIGQENLTFLPGIRRPGVDLENSNGSPNPDGTGLPVFNRATEGTGPPIDFPLGDLEAGPSWLLNNVFDGFQKRGFLVSLVPGRVIGTTTSGEILIGVLEMEIRSDLAGLDEALVRIEGVQLGTTFNMIQFDDPGPGDTLNVLMKMPAGNEGVLGVTPIQSCTATVTDSVGGASGTSIDIDYIDPMVGGQGGSIALAIEGTTEHSFRITDGLGYEQIIPAVPGTTVHALSTAVDGTPVVGQSITSYSIYPRFEVPSGSGNIIDGDPRIVSVRWQETACSASFSPEPAQGGNSSLRVEVVNGVRLDGSYGEVETPSGTVIPLLDPVLQGNTLIFDSALDLADIGPGDYGVYPIRLNATYGQSRFCQAAVGSPPPINTTLCPELPIQGVRIGHEVEIMLSGIDALSFSVVHGNTNLEGLPEGPVTITLAGDTSILIRANGFDSQGLPTHDDIICPILFVPPGCLTLNYFDQEPPILLELVTDNAVRAEVEGEPMFPVQGIPGIDETIHWELLYDGGEFIFPIVTVTNPNGVEETCAWYPAPLIPTLGEVGRTVLIVSILLIGIAIMRRTRAPS